MFTKIMVVGGEGERERIGAKCGFPRRFLSGDLTNTPLHSYVQIQIFGSMNFDTCCTYTELKGRDRVSEEH